MKLFECVKCIIPWKSKTKVEAAPNVPALKKSQSKEEIFYNFI